MKSENEDAGLIFCSRKKTKDYRGNMNTTPKKMNFQKILSTNKKPTGNFIDNASYYSELIQKNFSSNFLKKTSILG